jgi:transketolase
MSVTRTNSPAPPAGRRSTREAYRELLAALLPEHGRLLCLDTDTGLFSRADFGAAAERYVNLGIAEHNLMGVAAGLAACGWIPFVNTMAAFASTRALEAVKIDIALNALPVRIAATHGGLAAGHFGPTHHGLEDLAIMRMLPSMTVLVPADGPATVALLRQSLELPGPVYIRLGRNPTEELDGGVPLPRVGRAQPLRHGDDIAIVACGPHPVLVALRAADELARLGVGATVLNLHTLKPLDVATLVAAADRTGLVVTVEEHWRDGGLGGLVAETLAELAPTRVIRIGLADRFVEVAGGHEDLLQRCGITQTAITAGVMEALRQQRRARRPLPDPELPARTAPWTEVTDDRDLPGVQR